METAAGPWQARRRTSSHSPRGTNSRIASRNRPLRFGSASSMRSWPPPSPNWPTIRPSWATGYGRTRDGRSSPCGGRHSRSNACWDAAPVARVSVPAGREFQCDFPGRGLENERTLPEADSSVDLLDLCPDGRGHEAFPSSAGSEVCPGRPSGAGTGGRRARRLGVVRVASEGGVRHSVGGAGGGTRSGSVRSDKSVPVTWASSGFATTSPGPENQILKVMKYVTGATFNVQLVWE